MCKTEQAMLEHDLHMAQAYAKRLEGDLARAQGALVIARNDQAVLADLLLATQSELGAVRKRLDEAVKVAVDAQAVLIRTNQQRQYWKSQVYRVIYGLPLQQMPATERLVPRETSEGLEKP